MKVKAFLDAFEADKKRRSEYYYRTPDLAIGDQYWDFWDEAVNEEIDDAHRWENYVSRVFKFDDGYVRVTTRIGKTEMQENDSSAATAEQVWPVEVTKTIFAKENNG